MKKAPKVKRKKYVTGGEVYTAFMTPEQLQRYRSYNNPDQATMYADSIRPMTQMQPKSANQVTMANGSMPTGVSGIDSTMSGGGKKQSVPSGGANIDYAAAIAAGASQFAANDGKVESPNGGMSATQSAVAASGPWGQAIAGVSYAGTSALEGSIDRDQYGAAEDLQDAQIKSSITTGLLNPSQNLDSLSNKDLTWDEHAAAFLLPGTYGITREKYKKEGAAKKHRQGKAGNATAAAGVEGYTHAAKGGTIKGQGTGTSDSIKGTLAPGSFVAIAAKKDEAQAIGERYLGWNAKKVAALAGGGVPVAVSNGEVVFTPEEVAKLTKMGINLDKLAPNAENGQKLKKGGTVADHVELVKKHFGVDTNAALAIMEEESGGDPDSTNTKNDNGTVDYGLMQINSVHIPELVKRGIIKSANDLYDPETNLKAAKYVYEDAGNKWTPWVAYGKAKAKNPKAFEPSIEQKSVKPELTNKEVLEFSKMLMDQNISDKHSSQKPVNGKLLGQLNEYDKQRIRNAYLALSKDYMPKGNVVTSEPNDPTLRPFDMNRHTEFIDQLIPSKEYKDIKPSKEVSKITVPSKNKGNNGDWVINEDGSVTQKNGDKFSGPLSREESIALHATAQEEAIAELGPMKQGDLRSYEDIVKEASKEGVLTDRDPNTGWKTNMDKLAEKPVMPDPKSDPNAGKRNLLDKIGGPAALGAIGQFGLGLYQNIKAGERPKDKVDAAIMGQLNDALNDRGWDPSVEAAANDKIELNRRADVQNTLNLAGGDTSTALAHAGGASLRANRAIVDLAKEKEGIKAMKNQRADNLSATVAGMKRNIFLDDLTAFKENQKASADLMNAGMANYFGALQNNEDKDREDERLAKYGGSSNSAWKYDPYTGKQK